MFSPNTLGLTIERRKAKTVLHCFVKIVNKYKRKPIRLWVDQGK